jgi:EAL domain-containing protein (putative c-di-GMP-specific phosphodiesterase class I)
VSAAGYRDGEQARSSLGMLRSLGVGIALDDFGRDGTSLATLRQLPLTMVKLDHRLSLDLGRNDVVIRAVVGMCRELGLQTVAEGIETRLQLEAAERTGLDAVQGFLIGIPTRAQDALTGLMPR